MKKIMLMSLILASCIIHAQKLKNETGNFASLKNETSVNVKFNYSHLKLLKENFTEDEYVSKRKLELNEKDKGNGDAWVSKWKSAKNDIWEPKFLELLEKTTDKKISFKEDNNSAKYTLMVDVVWIYPGWDVYMMKQPAKVTTNIKLVETSNPFNVVYQVDAIDAPGDQFGSNFSNESRVGEGFAKTAKTIGKKIAKEVK
ncbi:hypothetical protein H1R17_04340 [Flavobacterium sp. xlx-214]|uniref:hypothetical protein n=1 Tax=unclassified Flavobacterium TaxID=196869 RepID=UPI0013CFEA7F|nr:MULTISPECIES: hypothetical protein [unclassified Flavobacterium]MBA5792122.1 hypothetical protein [Flavobacterium sp. xlx-221]QMI84369.1 hypothetical protein H1R17_04340 [Flavobacterium sp. xlx-214]